MANNCLVAQTEDNLAERESLIRDAASATLIPNSRPPAHDPSIQNPKSKIQNSFDRPLLLVALVLTVIVLAYFWTPTDPDVWWHLRNGQVVATTGSVPLGDIYSYTVPGTRWIMQQWLVETAMYGIEQALGYWANVLLFGLVSAGVYAVLFAILRAQGAGRALAAAALLGAMVLDAPSWGVRPQVWTTLLFAGFLAILLRYRRGAVAAPAAPGIRAWIGPDRALWALPPLMLLWANVHAGFSAGLLLLGAFVVGEGANRLLHRSAAPLPPLLAVTAACAVLSLLNPNGLDLWLYPLTYLSGPAGNASRRFVQEWQPPALLTLRALPFILSLLALAALALGFWILDFGFWKSPRRERAKQHTQDPRSEDLQSESTPNIQISAEGPTRIQNPNSKIPTPKFPLDLSLLFALLGVTAMAFQAIRFMPLYGVVAAVAGAAWAAARWPRLGRAGESIPRTAEDAARQRLFGRLNMGVYAVATLILAGVMLPNARAQVHTAPLETDYPAGAVAYLAAPAAPLPQPVHLFHEYGWGGYLIAHNWPVFVDGRADPYNALLADYVAAIGGVDWQPLFARYGVNAVLIRPGGPLDTALHATPGWRLAYQDRGAVLYIKQ